MAALTGIALGAGALAQLGGSAIGALSSSSARDEAKALSQEAYKELINAGYPPDLSREIILDKFRSAGTLTPDLEKEIHMEVSKVSEIQEAPELREAQLSALEALKERGTTGFTPEEKAEYNKLRADVQRDIESKRQQILQQYAQRGQGGSGQELAAQLALSQAGAQRASEEGDRLSAEASKRALQSILGSGQLGGQVRAQDFDVSRAKAQAADELSRFNIENARGVQMRNIAAQNLAQERNLREAQRISDVNTQMANAERYRQAEARRQYYTDLANRAQGLASAKLGQAAERRQEGAETAQRWQNIGTGLGSIAGSIGGYARDKEMQDYQRERDRKEDEFKKSYLDTVSGTTRSPQYGPWASGYGYK